MAFKKLAVRMVDKTALGKRFLNFLRERRLPFQANLGMPSYKASDYREYHSLAGVVYSPWFSDPSFLEIYGKYPEHFEVGHHEANRYFQYILARQALSVKGGDFIECGILTGKSFDIFANVLDRWDNQKRKIYGFDSFLGFAEPDRNDIDVRSWRQSFKAGSCRGWEKEKIEQALLYHKCEFKLVKGWIPDCFAGYENKQFCFAHIDVDLYRSTYDTIAFIYPRLLKGGIALLDDYGMPMVPGSRKAIEDYLSDKPELPIALPTGQAFIMKL